MEHEKAIRITNAIINELCDRCGFDNWWDDLDRDIRQEIREKLTDIIEFDSI